MRVIKFLLVLFSFSLILLVACNDDNVTYAEELKAEQDIIKDFLKRNQIKVVNTLPEGFPWPDNVYYKSKTGLYFRLTDKGDHLISDSIVAGDEVVTRFLQYTLTAKADTVSSESSIDFPEPYEFKYLDLSQACQGWHEAVGYMGFNNSKGKLIIPSKISFSSFNRPATPIGYDMEIRIKKY
ncbi:MAG: hypothetical protein BGO29_14100 [Bacteroidales bacterium 36-12]|nr:MAG: hypothetical protein BGO29_14100 [Bacteroidales bacterium 36-12]